ncbi:RNA polymerase sigma factor [Verticiella alkaliphila]|uniref:RNA polymerase sigma factor n=1 Tax=Verticiella alkaliphila TaxID=2779529 RepID=UPI00209A748A|nr:sigma-70 family RNA polymerase sigma factor [Verticiella sp. GG226]
MFPQFIPFRGRAVFERYYRDLLNFCLRFSGNADAALDTVQETYARALGARREGEAVTAPRALLYRIARNVMIDQHRRDTIRAVDEDGVDAQAERLAAPAASEPESLAMSAQAVDDLIGAIQALPPRCREAFVMHRFEGYSHGEIAERMQISQKMVEQHITSALRACRASRQAWQARHADVSPRPAQDGSRAR